MENRMKNRFMGRNLGTHFLLLITVMIWGSTWAAGRFLSFGLNEGDPANLDPATSAWLRYAFALIAFFTFFILSRSYDVGFRFLPPDKNSWKFSIWLGVFGTMAYQLLYMHGMKWTAAGDASLMISLNPVFTVLLASPMLGQKISARMAIGLLVGISGVSVVVAWSPNSSIPFEHRVIGDIMILGAAMCWAATTNLTKIFLSNGDDISALETVVWYSLTGWLLLTPWMIMEIWASGVPSPSILEWLTIGYLGVFSTVFAYVLFAKGIEVIGPTAAASYIFLLPVFGVIGGWYFLNERIGFSLIVGFILIVLGVRTVQIESERFEIS